MNTVVVHLVPSDGGSATAAELAYDLADFLLRPGTPHEVGPVVSRKLAQVGGLTIDTQPSS